MIKYNILYTHSCSAFFLCIFSDKKKKAIQIYSDLVNFSVCGILMIAASLFSSLCCTCGVPIPPNPANMCVACLRTQVDISEGIPKQVTVHFCKQCERFVTIGDLEYFLLHGIKIEPIDSC